jgi:arylformamidase
LVDGVTVDELALDRLIGPAFVVDLPSVAAVTARDLNCLALPPETERLLIRTRNSALWAACVAEFDPDFVALTAGAAQWIVDRGIRLIGVDYLSVQRFGDPPLTHEILLRAGVLIIEGLDLSAVQPGTHHLICLPLRILGAEGAPARAVLSPLNRGTGLLPRS